MDEIQLRNVPNSRASTDTPEVPETVRIDAQLDEGYAWVTACACATLAFFYTGSQYAWGVMQLRLSQDGLAPAAELAFVGSLASSLLGFLALVSTRVVRRIGSRFTVTIGVCCLGSGWILSGWTCTSVPGLFITAGVLPGIGTAMCHMACVPLLGQYFQKKRGIANGIFFAGGGLGGTVIALINSAAVARLGVAWAFRILGLSVLVICLPVTFLLKERERSSFPIIEWSLFRDARFTLLFIAGGIATFPLYVAPFFLPMYTTNVLHLSPSLSAVILALFNIASTSGRLAFGTAADIIGPLNSLLLALVLTTLSMLAIWPISESLGPLVIFVILNGASNGGFFSTIPPVLASVFGRKRLATSTGMIMTAWSAGYLMGAPIAGYILQASGGSYAGLAAYRPAMYYAGSLSLASAGMAGGISTLLEREGRWLMTRETRGKESFDGLAEQARNLLRSAQVDSKTPPN